MIVIVFVVRREYGHGLTHRHYFTFSQNTPRNECTGELMEIAVSIDD